MTSTEYLGLAAAGLTTMAFFPQAVHSWRSRDVSGVSLTMYGTFTFGVVLWLIYGVLIDSLPVILSNGVTLPLSMSILYLKIREGKINTSEN
jgi:MtN3 and saliva related transmembrane protein